MMLFYRCKRFSKSSVWWLAERRTFSGHCWALDSRIGSLMSSYLHMLATFDLFPLKKKTDCARAAPAVTGKVLKRPSGRGWSPSSPCPAGCGGDFYKLTGWDEPTWSAVIDYLQCEMTFSHQRIWLNGAMCFLNPIKGIWNAGTRLVEPWIRLYQMLLKQRFVFVHF